MNEKHTLSLFQDFLSNIKYQTEELIMKIKKESNNEFLW